MATTKGTPEAVTQGSIRPAHKGIVFSTTYTPEFQEVTRSGKPKKKKSGKKKASGGKKTSDGKKSSAGKKASAKSKKKTAEKKGKPKTKGKSGKPKSGNAKKK